MTKNEIAKELREMARSRMFDDAGGVARFGRGVSVVQ